MSTLRKLQDLKFELRKLFTYASDMETEGRIEDFRSNYREFLVKKKFKGDCDNHAWTACDIAILEYDFARENVFFFRGKTRSCPPAWKTNHAWAGFLIDGEWWFIDHRPKHIESLDDLVEKGFEFYCFHPYTEPIENWYLADLKAI